jgi:hypothetical protein
MSKRHVQQSRLSDAQADREKAQRAISLKDADIATLRAEIARLQAEVAEREAKEAPMHVGAVAMIDALGFKGIYRRHKPQAVIERMRAIRREVEDYPNGAVVPSIIRIVNVSDMIVIGLYDVEGDSSLTIASVAFLVSKLLLFAANGEPAFAYRGCIAYGEFEMDDNVLLGPAIDEAAGSAEQAEASIVWCTPSAVRELRSPADEHLFRGDVPLKEGLRYKSYLVRPWLPTQTIHEVTKTMERILGTFDVRAPGREEITIAVKKQLTERFLAEAKDTHKHDPNWTFQV